MPTRAAELPARRWRLRSDAAVLPAWRVIRSLGERQSGPRSPSGRIIRYFEAVQSPTFRERPTGAKSRLMIELKLIVRPPSSHDSAKVDGWIAHGGVVDARQPNSRRRGHGIAAPDIRVYLLALNRRTEPGENGRVEDGRVRSHQNPRDGREGTSGSAGLFISAGPRTATAQRQQLRCGVGGLDECPVECTAGAQKRAPGMTGPRDRSTGGRRLQFAAQCSPQRTINPADIMVCKLTRASRTRTGGSGGAVDNGRRLDQRKLLSV